MVIHNHEIKIKVIADIEDLKLENIITEPDNNF